MNAFQDQPTSQRQQTVYERTYMRNIPSQPLQPYLDARPVQTKYSIMPIVDPTKPIQTPLKQQPTYTPETVYNPGNDFGPWSGYASNVNHESELRNQIFALQSCSQATYVPSSKSSLYQVKWNNTNSNSITQPFPKLFESEKFNPMNPNPNANTVGFALFNNATRQQLKDIKNDTICN
jgi:hypothetical protein